MRTAFLRMCNACLSRVSASSHSKGAGVLENMSSCQPGDGQPSRAVVDPTRARMTWAAMTATATKGG